MLRRGELRVVVQLHQAILDGGAIGNLIEVRGGDLVLSFDPGSDFRRLVVFEPAIRIGNAGAEINVNRVGLLRGRVTDSCAATAFSVPLRLGDAPGRSERQRHDSQRSQRQQSELQILHLGWTSRDYL